MKFSCEKQSLLAAVQTAARAAAARTPISVLEGLLLQASADCVKITGYDLKTGIIATVEADVSEEGEIVLGARLLGEIIRKLPGAVVEISASTDYKAEIVCELSRFEILGASAADYPELPSVDSNNYIDIPERDIKKMISQTNFAVSDNESRPIHTGALFECEQDILTIVAVDGYRLALRREKITSGNGAASSFVVPGHALAEVEKIASDDERDVTIVVGAKHILFKVAGTIVISRRLEGEFLNYRNSIPRDCKIKLRIQRRELVDSVERVSLVISDKIKSPIRCQFGNGSVVLLSSSAFGRASDECELIGNGEDVEIGFNNKYLLDALKAAPADEVVIQLTTGVAPCIITPVEDDSQDMEEKFLYMILPVRLKAYEN